jgi:hypothetical protein
MPDSNSQHNFPDITTSHTQVLSSTFSPIPTTKTSAFEFNSIQTTSLASSEKPLVRPGNPELVDRVPEIARNAISFISDLGSDESLPVVYNASLARAQIAIKQFEADARAGNKVGMVVGISSLVCSILTALFVLLKLKLKTFTRRFRAFRRRGCPPQRETPRDSPDQVNPAVSSSRLNLPLGPLSGSIVQSSPSELIEMNSIREPERARSSRNEELIHTDNLDIPQRPSADADRIDFTNRLGTPGNPSVLERRSPLASSTPNRSSDRNSISVSAHVRSNLQTPAPPKSVTRVKLGGICGVADYNVTNVACVEDLADSFSEFLEVYPDLMKALTVVFYAELTGTVAVGYDELSKSANASWFVSVARAFEVMARLYRLRVSNLITVDRRFGHDYTEAQLVELLRDEAGVTVEIKDKTMHIMRPVAVGSESRLTFFEDFHHPFSDRFLSSRSFVSRNQTVSNGNELGNASSNSGVVENVVGSVN